MQLPQTCTCTMKQQLTLGIIMTRAAVQVRVAWFWGQFAWAPATPFRWIDMALIIYHNDLTQLNCKVCHIHWQATQWVRDTSQCREGALAWTLGWHGQLPYSRCSLGEPAYLCRIPRPLLSDGTISYCIGDSQGPAVENTGHPGAKKPGHFNMNPGFSI